MAALMRVEEAFQTYQSATEDIGFQLLDQLELLILDHLPQSGGEAIAMLEMVGVNLEAGGRGDGRDMKALRRVIEFLQRNG